MPSRITTNIGVRIKNEHLEAIDQMVEWGAFPDRSSAVRAFVAPAFEMCFVAMTTKSKMKAIGARMQAEADLMIAINKILKKAEVQDVISFEDLDVSVT
jgi:Arc/MetJ-type ribon-helix-helix transcriptional regulator